MSRGEETRERIVAHGMTLASRDGLEGLSIGTLAAALGMSKSGLFAHFGSKEDLQVAVIERAASEFARTVVLPALQARRGLVRLRQLFERWMRWIVAERSPGGCLLFAAGVELDDQPGRPRDVLVENQTRMMDTIQRIAAGSVTEGELRRGLDLNQFAFEMTALMLGFHHARRLLRVRWAERALRTAFEGLLDRAR